MSSESDDDYPDSQSLLMDVDGWILKEIENGLQHNWKDVANLCVGFGGANIYR